MKRTVNRIGLALWLLCGGTSFWLGPWSAEAPVDAALPPRQALPVWNQPYVVKGVRYVPMSFDRAEDYQAIGLASWYGLETYRRPGGDRTAMGEPFHPDRISAAHRTLPLPVTLRVTNLDNGRSLVVRVNDRGPFPSDGNPASGERLLDLSAGAARALGFYRRGLARVKIETIKEF